MGSATDASPRLTDAEALEALSAARERTLDLVAPIGHEDLERVHSSLMSPLVWDLGHIAAFEDLWLAHRTGGSPLLREDLAEVYDAFETPRAGRGDLPYLGTDEAIEYLARVRERTLELIETRGVGDGVPFELVLRHEQQHNETMLQTIQLARLEGYRRPHPGGPLSDPRSRATGPDALSPGGGGGGGGGASADSGLDLIEVPAGECTIGAAAGGFAYDNERPRHRTDVRAFRIGRTPITNASYLHFVEGGGYERREWWCDEGWAWKEQYDITRPGGWSADLHAEWRLGALQPLDPDRPVVHVSWFEADAFARSHGLRLPTEREWEKAATWDQGAGRALPSPWGEGPATAGVHANLDARRDGPEPVATASAAGTSPSGCEAMIGDVWEWTADCFAGYEGFTADPYREYSEVFFGPEYKVLRGGSWATCPRVATATFRNWDLPARRQIFSGFRVAGELADLRSGRVRPEGERRSKVADLRSERVRPEGERRSKVLP